MEEKSENSEKETIDLSSPIMPLEEQQSSNLAPKFLSMMCWMVFLCVKFFFTKLLTCVLISFDPQDNQYTSIIGYSLIHVCGCMY